MAYSDADLVRMQEKVISREELTIAGDRGDRGNIGNMSAAEDTEHRQRELAVLAAACEASKAWDGRGNEEAAFQDLAAAVEAYEALTEPQPVDPQTLPAGTKFKFSEDHPYQDGCLYCLVKPTWSYDAVFCVRLGTWDLCQFTNDIRVIPLPEETE